MYCTLPPKTPGGDCTHDGHCNEGKCIDNVCKCCTCNNFTGKLCRTPPIKTKPQCVVEKTFGLL
jgi:hypothetical protein